MIPPMRAVVSVAPGPCRAEDDGWAMVGGAPPRPAVDVYPRIDLVGRGCVVAVGRRWVVGEAWRRRVDVYRWRGVIDVRARGVIVAVPAIAVARERRPVAKAEGYGDCAEAQRG